MSCTRVVMGEGSRSTISPLTHHRAWTFRVALSLKGRGHNNKRRKFAATAHHPTGLNRYCSKRCVGQ